MKFLKYNRENCSGCSLYTGLGPHGSEGMTGDHVRGYVGDSAAHMVTKHTIKDVKTSCMTL